MVTRRTECVDPKRGEKGKGRQAIQKGEPHGKRKSGNIEALTRASILRDRVANLAARMADSPMGPPRCFTKRQIEMAKLGAHISNISENGSRRKEMALWRTKVNLEKKMGTSEHSKIVT